MANGEKFRQLNVANEYDEGEEAEVISFTVKTIDLTGGGFWKKYRSVIAMKTAFLDPESATIELIDDAEGFLLGQIVEPKDIKEKRKILYSMSAEKLSELFEMVIGGEQTAVPPQSGEV